MNLEPLIPIASKLLDLALALIGRRRQVATTARPVDIATGTESGAAASREGKIASSRAKSNKSP